MVGKIAIVSTSGLENWDWQNPWTKGIGGSETSAIECATGLHYRFFKISAFTPCAKKSVSPDGVPYFPLKAFKPQNFKVVINYRHMPLFDKPKPEGAKWWFVAQDVDYPPELTEERLGKIDRYICLCKTQANFTMSKYPMLRGKVYISGNGVRADYIRSYEQNAPPRNTKQLLYASSPDRGLKLLLENWFRIREKVPDAELHVAYGFENMEKIVALMGGNDWRGEYQKELEALRKQPGVTFTGRLNQLDLYKEWFEAGIWFHPSDWPETSCITSMDAMACGAWPITNRYWAVGENMERIGCGDLFSGVPQKSELIRSYMIEKCCERLLNPPSEGERVYLMDRARKLFDWNLVVNQWMGWLREDLGK